MEVVPIHGDFEVDCDWLGNSDQWQLAIHDDNSVRKVKELSIM